MITPTSYFRDMWRERVSLPLPSVEDLNEAVSESIRLQVQRDLFTPRGRRYRVLAMYWNPVKGVVFKVDHKTRKLVSVFSSVMLEDEECRMISW